MLQIEQIEISPDRNSVQVISVLDTTWRTIKIQQRSFVAAERKLMNSLKQTDRQTLPLIVCDRVLSCAAFKKIVIINVLIYNGVKYTLKLGRIEIIWWLSTITRNQFLLSRLRSFFYLPEKWWPVTAERRSRPWTSVVGYLIAVEYSNIAQRLWNYLQLSFVCVCQSGGSG